MTIHKRSRSYPKQNTWREGYDRDPECLWQGGHWTDRATDLCIRCQQEALKETRAAVNRQREEDEQWELEEGKG